ncbi:reverse transcriptase domain-containing protein [Vreelandella populi]|nr:reverse transcriptase domain-containing protein [Halomonas populi]
MLDTKTTPHELAVLLGTTYSKLCYTLYKKHTDNLYKDFTIPKKNGGVRKISSPKPILKNLQSKLKLLLDDIYRPHPSASAFIANRGLIYNTTPHIKKALIFNIDLKSFYGSIHFGRVKGMLISKPYCLREDTAQLIAHICCYYKTIPQGAPTSTTISNMICRRLDRELSFLAKKNHAYYTRYADDLTFSFHKIKPNEICAFEDNIWKPSDRLINVISNNTFKINNTKTRGETSRCRQVVTGLKVNTKVNVDRRYIRTTKAMIHSLSLDIESANEYFSSIRKGENEATLETVVAGRINFIGMVKGTECSIYQTLAHKFNNLNIDLKVPTRSNIDTTSQNDNQLKTLEYRKQEKLKKCIWVVSFDGIEGIELDEQLTQGTAFMIKGQKLLTCNHTFEKAGNPSYCLIHRIDDSSIKYYARLVKVDKHRDVALLEIDSKDKVFFDHLEIYFNDDMHSGYKVNLAGFPEYRSGHRDVTVLPSTIIRHEVVSLVKHYSVNSELLGGFSGGPVLNLYNQVVGMVTKGRYISHDKDAGQSTLEGSNSFISAVEFEKFLGSSN